MATYSRTASGDPEIGFRHDNGLWRAVVGWNHNDDTPQGIETGKLWCWVSSSPAKFQVFDQEFNRSPTKGEIRDCGVANFTMIRMFHPYWTPRGEIPRDGVCNDKSRCRWRYHQLMRRHRLTLGLPVDEDPAEYAARKAAEKKEKAAQTKALAEIAGEKLDAQRKMRDEQEVDSPEALEETAESSNDDQIFLPEEKDDIKLDLPADEEHGVEHGMEVYTGEGSLHDPIELD